MKLAFIIGDVLRFVLNMVVFTQDQFIHNSIASSLVSWQPMNYIFSLGEH